MATTRGSRHGRERLTALTVAAAHAWRQQQTETIEQGLAGVDARLAADLKTELDCCASRPPNCSTWISPSAAGLREVSAAEAAAKGRELAEREAALYHALGLLDLAAQPR